MRHITLSTAFIFPIFAFAMNVPIQQKPIPTSHSQRLGNILIYRTQDGFNVIKDGTIHPVHSYDVDPVLRRLDNHQLARVLQTCHIRVSQMSNEDYKLTLQAGLKGGGIWGATIGCFVGKFVASVVCHGAIALVAAGTCMVAGPVAGYAVGAGLEGTFGAAIETTTTTAAIAAGITGAVLTGPV